MAELPVDHELTLPLLLINGLERLRMPRQDTEEKRVGSVRRRWGGTRRNTLSRGTTYFRQTRGLRSWDLNRWIGTHQELDLIVQSRSAPPYTTQKLS